MINNNIDVAETYYTSMRDKNFTAMAVCLHPEVSFVGPLATMIGKAQVVEAAKKFAAFFTSLVIQDKFNAEHPDKVMLVLEFNCPEPVGAFRAASFLSFTDGLIASIELFYDARPFESKKDAIFTKN
jgi:hypothetical protein